MYAADASVTLARAYKKHNITPAEAIDLEREFDGYEDEILKAIGERTAYRRPDGSPMLRYHAKSLADLRDEPV